MFKSRLISSIIIMLMTIITLFFGGNVTFGVIAIISIIGLFELLRVFQLEKTGLGIMAYGGTAVYYLLLYANYHYLNEVFLIGYLMALLVIYVFTFPKYKVLQVSQAFFSMVYVSIMLSYIYRIRTMPLGGILVVLIFISAWGNDTCAYCVGVLFGKHKMAPKLSPKKSIEGAVGGIVGATLLGAVYGYLVSTRMVLVYNPIIVFAATSFAGALISIIGDLTASAIKRNYNIKDYGNLIPGHGGILDRFDSIIFAAPTVYYVMVLLTLS